MLFWYIIQGSIAQNRERLNLPTKGLWCVELVSLNVVEKFAKSDFHRTICSSSTDHLCVTSQRASEKSCVAIDWRKSILRTPQESQLVIELNLRIRLTENYAAVVTNPKKYLSTIHLLAMLSKIPFRISYSSTICAAWCGTLKAREAHARSTELD